MKYLLTAGIASAAEHYNLKAIDVVCLDPDNTVEGRYKSQFNFPNFRFANANIMDYLGRMAQKLEVMGEPTRPINFNFIEPAHADFFSAFFDS